MVLDGFHGLGVLASQARLEAAPGLAPALERLRSPEFTQEWARELERDRIEYSLMAWRAMGKPGPGELEADR
jgi:hypothetical protein